MKELSIEEKAKRYDKALERAKKINIEHSKRGFKSSDDVLYIFPELADKVIREEIINFLRLPHPQFVGKRDHEEWIAWLEKQGEQKSAWSEEDEETFGYLEDVVDFCYRNQFVVKVQIHEKVRQLVSRLKSLYFQSEWSKNDITRIDEIIETLYIVQANRVRTQRMHYNKATIDKNIDWLKSLKDRVQPQNIAYYNPYKEVVESIAEMCEKYKLPISNLSDFLDNVRIKCKEAKEYDSMFPQKQWRPSEEQIKDFESVINDLDRMYSAVGHIDNHTKKHLIEILEQLKAL